MTITGAFLPVEALPADSVARKIATMRASAQEESWILPVGRNPRTYLISGFKTLEVPFNAAAQVLLDIDNFDSVFSYVHRMEPIGELKPTLVSQTYLGEARAWIYRVWGVGIIDSLLHTAERIEIAVSQVDDERMVTPYRQEAQGFLTFELKKMKLHGYLDSIDASSCRFGVVATAQAHMPIPAFIFRFIAARAIPRFYHNLCQAALRTTRRTSIK